MSNTRNIKHLDLDLIAIDGSKNLNRLNLLLSIANHSQQKLSFNSIKIFTGCNTRAVTPPDNVELLSSDIHSIKQYNNFMLKQLYKHIHSKHCLIYQHDGYIHKPENWDDIFLQYDYIGAVWQKAEGWCLNNRVGNGGFSLRSKKLMAYFADIEIDTDINEDMYICLDRFEDLLACGIKFAPPEVACRFSLEENTEFNSDINKTFGFHGSSDRKHLYDRTKLLHRKHLNINI